MKGGKVEEIIEQTVTIVGELENWREFEWELVKPDYLGVEMIGFVEGNYQNDLKVVVVSKKEPSLWYVTWKRRNKLHVNGIQLMQKCEGDVYKKKDWFMEEFIH
jgi:hypothetical protein